MSRTAFLLATIAALLITGSALGQNPWRLSVSASGAQPRGGVVAQLSVSHDSLLGPLGLRASAETGFGPVPFSLAAGIFDRGNWGPVDIHGGLGAGVTFAPAGVLVFGEVLLGASYYLTDSVGVFAEVRYRPYFDGSATGLAGATAGVQFRF